jgi:hypothetical protein
VLWRKTVFDNWSMTYTAFPSFENFATKIFDEQQCNVLSPSLACLSALCRKPYFRRIVLLVMRFQRSSFLCQLYVIPRFTRKRTK